MKKNLIDLNPKFLDHGGEGITRDRAPVPLQVEVGVGFDCP